MDGWLQCKEKKKGKTKTLCLQGNEIWIACSISFIHLIVIMWIFIFCLQSIPLFVGNGVTNITNEKIEIWGESGGLAAGFLELIIPF